MDHTYTASTPAIHSPLQNWLTTDSKREKRGKIGGKKNPLKYCYFDKNLNSGVPAVPTHYTFHRQSGGLHSPIQHKTGHFRIRRRSSQPVSWLSTNTTKETKTPEPKQKQDCSKLFGNRPHLTGVLFMSENPENPFLLFSSFFPTF